MADQGEDFDSWEDIDEEDLLRRLSNRQKKLSNKEKPKIPISDSSGIDDSPKGHSIADGPLKIKYSEGTEYVAPIKILKRPGPPSHSQLETETRSDHKPIKSLAQREAEYNSARARILGEKCNCDTETSIPVIDSSVKIIRQPKGPPPNPLSQ